MASSVAEMRAHTNGTITLPSGLVVEYRRVQSRDFMPLGELAIPQSAERSADQAPAEDARHEQLRIKRYTDHAIAVCVRAPRMSDALDAHGAPLYSEAWVHVAELDDADYQALALAIATSGGLTPEVATAVDTFRDHEVGAVGQVNGADVSHPPFATFAV